MRSLNAGKRGRRPSLHADPGWDRSYRMFTTAANADWANSAIAVAKARANVITRLILPLLSRIKSIVRRNRQNRKNLQAKVGDQPTIQLDGT